MAGETNAIYHVSPVEIMRSYPYLKKKKKKKAPFHNLFCYKLEYGITVYFFFTLNKGKFVHF